jgi:ribonuclease HI
MKKVLVYTDGSADNPGPGGWGAVLLYGKHRKEIRGSHESTTNNVMELRAVTEALSAIHDKGVHVVVFTDSQYVIGCATRWYKKWVSNGWKTASGKKVRNKHAIETMQSEIEKFKYRVQFAKVPGHEGIKENERAHDMAYAEKCKAAQRVEAEVYNVLTM